MRQDLTHITLVVDRSGSMQTIRDDAEGGVNAFIEEQRFQDGEALLTLVQFDTEYEFVHKGVAIGDVPEYKLVPRAGTALLDAVGRAINETEERLAKMEEQDHPGLVIFVVTTDGHENSSKEFTKAEINKMIERKQNKSKWHFTFLGADQEAFAEAGGMGILAGGVSRYSRDKVFAAYGAASSKVARMRAQRRTGEEVVNEFTDEERKKMN